MTSWCIVPKCPNTSFTTPNKTFIQIPKDTDTRKEWLAAIKRKAKSWTSSIQILHICEDHFDLENDLENWDEYETFNKNSVKVLKKNVVPHRFGCQNKKNKLPKKIKLTQTETLATHENRLLGITDTSNEENTIVIDDSSSSSEDEVIITEENITESASNNNMVDLSQKTTEKLDFPCLECQKLFKTSFEWKHHSCKRVSANLNDDTTCKCIFNQLQRRNISNIDQEEMRTICSGGRPPVKSINTNFAKNSECLAECICNNVIYCWPCFIFRPLEGRFGSKNCDLQEADVKSHETSESHIRAHLELKILSASLEKTKKETDNKTICSKIRKELFHRLVDAALFMVTPISDTQNRTHKGYYNKLLRFLSKYDPLLSMCTQQIISSDLSVQNRVIGSIRSIMLNTIKEEINRTDFVVLLFDETSDIPLKSQVSITLRYLDESHRVQERFLYFTDLSTDRTVLRIYCEIFKVVQEFNIENKLIAYSVDSAILNPLTHVALRKLIQEKYPNMHFIHNHHHSVNYILQQACGHNTKCRKFFQTLIVMKDFFMKLDTSDFDAFCKQYAMISIDKESDIQHLLTSIKEQRLEYLNYFRNVCQASDNLGSSELVQAQSFVSFLIDNDNIFLSILFDRIFNIVKSFVPIVNLKDFNIYSYIDKLRNILSQLRELKTVGCEGLPSDINNVYYFDAYIPPLFSDILDKILWEFKYRFQSTKNLNFFALLNIKTNIDQLKFEQFKYVTYFNEIRLKRELNVLHSTPEFETVFSVNNVLKFFSKNMWHIAMPEVFKLAKMIKTLPLSTGECNNSYLKRIELFCKTTPRENFSNLSLVIIETQLLTDLRTLPSFSDIVYAHFIEKESSNDNKNILLTNKCNQD